LPSKPSHYGLPTEEMKAKLYDVIRKDARDRKRADESLDTTLMQKLHTACIDKVKDPAETNCVLRRVLTVYYSKISLEEIDAVLESADLLAASPIQRAAVPA
jgi:hypothetical protein